MGKSPIEDHAVFLLPKFTRRVHTETGTYRAAFAAPLHLAPTHVKCHLKLSCRSLRIFSSTRCQPECATVKVPFCLGQILFGVLVEMGVLGVSLMSEAKARKHFK